MIKELTDFSDISGFGNLSDQLLYLILWAGGDSMMLYKLEEVNSRAAKW